MAPLVVKDRVIVGPSAAESSASTAGSRRSTSRSGKVIWTRATTSAPMPTCWSRQATFKPFYDKGADLGLTTWPKDAWKQAGAPVWGWLSYDPELDLVYYGVGNPGPYNAEQRPGDNKWTNSVLARAAG